MSPWIAVILTPVCHHILLLECYYIWEFLAIFRHASHDRHDFPATGCCDRGCFFPLEAMILYCRESIYRLVSSISHRHSEWSLILSFWTSFATISECPYITLGSAAATFLVFSKVDGIFEDIPHLCINK